MPDDSDLRLQLWLDRLRAGDPTARNEVIRHSQDRLRLLTRHLLQRDFPRLQRWVDTSDVFQDVLIRLDRAVRAVTVSAPADWFRLAALQIRRELLDLCGHHFGPHGQATHHHTPDGEPAGELAAASDDPHSLAEWHELHQYIAALPDAERALFDLLYYQGLTQPEASVLLGMPLRTLKAHWQKARLRLVERFGTVPSI
jgi:RNA polymerase sigma factor (sigma-70 family)